MCAHARVRECVLAHTFFMHLASTSCTFQIENQSTNINYNHHLFFPSRSNKDRQIDTVIYIGYTHCDTYTCERTHTHTYTHTVTHTLLSHTHTVTHTQIHDTHTAVIHTHTHTGCDTHPHKYTHTHTLPTPTQIHTQTLTCVFVWVGVTVCMCACQCVCMYIATYIYIRQLRSLRQAFRGGLTGSVDDEHPPARVPVGAAVGAHVSPAEPVTGPHHPATRRLPTPLTPSRAERLARHTSQQRRRPPPPQPTGAHHHRRRRCSEHFSKAGARTRYSIRIRGVLSPTHTRRHTEVR